MRKKVLFILIIIVILLLPKTNKYTNISNISIDYKPGIRNHIKLFKDNNIGYITIKKINLKKKLYPINDKKNNVEENVTILNESTFPKEKESTMIIAAHSGTSNISYFKDLDKLTKGDIITLTLNNINYNYEVQSKWEVIKNGIIKFPIIKQKQLILTTCSPNKDKYQLIINCTLKE